MHVTIPGQLSPSKLKALHAINANSNTCLDLIGVIDHVGSCRYQEKLEHFRAKVCQTV